jgi:DNA-binding MarR family transcriptional regulator
VPVESYVLDVLLRDLVGHDKQPAAFLVYLYLYGAASLSRWRPVQASLRDIADVTGLSKSAVETAMNTLRRRQLLTTDRKSRTARPEHRVLRHWNARRSNSRPDDGKQ